MHHSPTRHRSRTGVAALCLGLGLVVAAGSGAVAATPAQTEATTAGATAAYLAAHGDHFHTTFSGTEYADYGLTLDGVLGLAAADAGANQANASMDYVADNLASYIGSGTESYAGATAKSLLLASVTGRGRVVGDTNLVARLRPLENASGRFKDASSFGDFSNTFSQSFALMGLRRAGAYISDAAVSYLYRQQCPGGGFRVTLGYTACSSASDSDTDATAIALQAMALVPHPGASANVSRIKTATQYLKQQQLPDGGLPAAGKTTSNTNTTGLAVAVMKSEGYTGFATRATAYLAGLQYGCDAPPALRGLVAYDSASKTTGLAGAADSQPSDKDLRATPAALVGLSDQIYRYISTAGDMVTTSRLSC